MFSKACEYGIRACIYIAGEKERVSLKAIAEAIDSPEAFTAKILQQLGKKGILQSLKGPTGGFSLAMSADKIPLAGIVAAIDGDDIYRGCGLGLSECSETNPCPLHWKFKAIREDLRIMLENTTLMEMSDQLDDKLVRLRIIN